MRLIIIGIAGLLFVNNRAFAEGTNAAALRLSQAAGISQETARNEIERVFAAVKAEMLEGREVSVKGFGRFYVKDRSPRRGRNPKTGASLEIPARRYPRFVSAARFKSELNPPGAAVALTAVSPSLSSPQPASAPAPASNAEDRLLLPR